MAARKEGKYRRRPTEVNAIRVGEIVKQPKLLPHLKTNLPEACDPDYPGQTWGWHTITQRDLVEVKR